MSILLLSDVTSPKNFFNIGNNVEIYTKDTDFFRKILEEELIHVHAMHFHE